MNGRFFQKALGGVVKPAGGKKQRNEVLSRLKLKEAEESQEISGRLKLKTSQAQHADKKWQHDRAPRMKITIRRDEKKQEESTETLTSTVSLKNLSSKTTHQHISELFKPIAGLKWVKINQGEADVVFNSLASAKQAALFADKKFLDGEVIEASVKPLARKRDRSRSSEAALNKKIQKLISDNQKKLQEQIAELVAAHKKSQ